MRIFEANIPFMVFFFQFVALVFDAKFFVFAVLRFEANHMWGSTFNNIAKSLALLGTIKHRTTPLRPMFITDAGGYL